MPRNGFSGKRLARRLAGEKRQQEGRSEKINKNPINLKTGGGCIKNMLWSMQASTADIVSLKYSWQCIHIFAQFSTDIPKFPYFFVIHDSRKIYPTRTIYTRYKRTYTTNLQVNRYAYKGFQTGNFDWFLNDIFNCFSIPEYPHKAVSI